MTKQEILDYFSLIDFAYNESGRLESLSRMLDKLLKEQEAVKRTYRTGINGFSIIWTCGACGSDLHPNNAEAKFCSKCGKPVLWEGR